MKFLNDQILALEKEIITSDKIVMEKYMKNKFEFFGVRSPARKKIFSQLWKKHGLPEKESYKAELMEMFNHPKREMGFISQKINKSICGW